MGNSENIEFSRSFVAFDLKVGIRYRRLIELKLYECSRSLSFLDVGQWSFTIKTVCSSETSGPIKIKLHREYP